MPKTTTKTDAERAAEALAKKAKGKELLTDRTNKAAAALKGFPALAHKSYGIDAAAAGAAKSYLIDKIEKAFAPFAGGVVETEGFTLPVAPKE